MMSYILLGLLAVAAGIGDVSSYVRAPGHGRFDVSKLLRTREQDLEITDPAVSTQCFNTYLPQLDDAANTWSTSYNACLSNASNARTTLNTKLTQDQANINASATTVIEAISGCQQYPDALDFFNCFGGLGRDTLNTLYIMSANASEDAGILSQQFGGIDTNMYICTNSTERVYVEQTAKVYDQLNVCLQNGPSDSNTEQNNSEGTTPQDQVTDNSTPTTSETSTTD